MSIQMNIVRGDEVIFQGETRSSQMKRSPGELVDYLTREMKFPYGVFLMTGTGVVPDDNFTLLPGDLVQIRIGSLLLENKTVSS